MKFLSALLLSLVSLTGCVTVQSGGDDTTAPLSAEDSYLANLKSGHPDETAGVPDEKLLSVGNGMCDILDSGTPINDIASAMNAAGVDPFLVGAVLGAAVKDLCPRHGDTLEAWLN